MWSPAKGNRFKEINSMVHDIPAPGTYNPSDKDSNNGYILSSNRNYCVPHFRQQSPPRDGKEQISVFCRSIGGLDTPGPGTYQVQGDFGVVYNQSVLGNRPTRNGVVSVTSRLQTHQDTRD